MLYIMLREINIMSQEISSFFHATQNVRIYLLVDRFRSLDIQNLSPSAKAKCPNCHGGKSILVIARIASVTPRSLSRLVKASSILTRSLPGS